MSGACSAPPNAARWTILETGFRNGNPLVQAANHWTSTARPPGLLHYVAVGDLGALARWRSGPDGEGLATPQRLPQTSDLDGALHEACASALPGIQRVLLSEGQISLTLCFGELLTMLSEQSFQADEIRMAWPVQGGADLWNRWAIQALCRRCKRGTVLRLEPATVDSIDQDLQATIALLSEQGFEWTSATTATYAPSWNLQRTRPTRLPLASVSPARCAVIGAGLSGASVAQAMAVRGWRVTVIDSSPEPAQGASGLPVGLVVPHLSADDSPRSRLSRVGARLTLAHAHHRLRCGEDWQPSGVLELRADAARQWSAADPWVRNSWLQLGQTAKDPTDWNADRDLEQSLWHVHAGWIKPRALIESWLAHQNVAWEGGAAVAGLQRKKNCWGLQDQTGTTLAEAEVVVFANAMGALPLLQGLDAAWKPSPAVLEKLRGCEARHGTVSHGSMPTENQGAFPPFPVNGHGSLMGHIPDNRGPRWYCGATYEPRAALPEEKSDHHRANWQRAAELIPEVAKVLEPALQAHQCEAWTGTRCVSQDRMPLVGPVHADAASGLWMSVAMGSRGLSFAALCAELLVAQLSSEPLPVETRLAKSLDLHRPSRSLN